jgi:septum formation protein
MESIILASASPRRSEILERCGIPHCIRPSNVDESVFDDIAPGPRTCALAALKARAIAENAALEDPRWVLGADTLVSIQKNGSAGTPAHVLGKPLNEEEAWRFLKLLSGSFHSVYTGLCAIDRDSGRTAYSVNETIVHFISLSDAAIKAYIASGQWQMAAGAYRIQEDAGYFADRICGSYTGVVGLPIADFYGILSALDYSFR